MSVETRTAAYMVYNVNADLNAADLSRTAFALKDDDLEDDDLEDDEFEDDDLEDVLVSQGMRRLNKEGISYYVHNWSS
jgi:hypothetical protein